jgi:hypothetical protein
MTKQNLVQLIGGTRDSDPALFHRVSEMLADKDPKLQSLLWMLREGVIGRRQFQDLLASAVEG